MAVDNIHRDRTRLLEGFYPEPWTGVTGSYFVRRYSLHFCGVVQEFDGAWKYGIGQAYEGMEKSDRFIMGTVCDAKTLMRAFERCDQQAQEACLL